MKLLGDIFERLIDYIVNVLAPAFGTLCVIFAGNWQTRVLGIVILIFDFISYKRKD